MDETDRKPYLRPCTLDQYNLPPECVPHPVPYEDDDFGQWPYCNVRKWVRNWRKVVAGTHLDNDQARRDFIDQHTEGAMNSLTLFLECSTTADAWWLLSCAVDEIQKRQFEQLLQDKDEK